jgi:hypothetical protein
MGDGRGGEPEGVAEGVDVHGVARQEFQDFDPDLGGERLEHLGVPRVIQVEGARIHGIKAGSRRR